jgi:hypothetical protein
MNTMRRREDFEHWAGSLLEVDFLDVLTFWLGNVDGPLGGLWG